MYGILNRATKKVFVASMALSTLRASSFCQDQVFNAKGLPGLGLPKFSKINSSTLESNVQDDLKKFKHDFEELNNSFRDKVTGADAVNKLEDVSTKLNNHWALVDHLMSVKNSEDLRKVQNKLQSEVSIAESGKFLFVFNRLLF